MSAEEEPKTTEATEETPKAEVTPAEEKESTEEEAKAESDAKESKKKKPFILQFCILYMRIFAKMNKLIHGNLYIITLS